MERSVNGKRMRLVVVALLLVGVGLSADDKDKKKPNPMLPGSKYRVHDMTRPQPRVVTPGEKPGD
ncbi:MAG: hypothetical protein GXP25_23120, partial [Planctomycetes bacterium]|nr:hypothetical protein [Planctomycetota bacterium]